MTSPTTHSEGLFARWARYAVRRRRRVLGGWFLAIVLLVGLSSTLGGNFVNNFTIPGTESQRAVDLLKERFPAQAGDSATLVVQADAGVTDPAVKARVEALLAEAAKWSIRQVGGRMAPPGGGAPCRNAWRCDR